MGITPHALERGGGDKSEILSILDLLLGQSKEALLLPPSGSFLRERGKKPKYNLPSCYRIGLLLGLLCRGGMSVKVSLAYKFFFTL